MPSADAPLNEDNIAEAIQQIKDARKPLVGFVSKGVVCVLMQSILIRIATNKKADLAQVFALRLDNVDTVCCSSYNHPASS